MSGDGDFSILMDYANKSNIETLIISARPKTTSKILKIKKYLTIEYLIELNKNFLIPIKRKVPH